MDVVSHILTDLNLICFHFVMVTSFDEITTIISWHAIELQVDVLDQG